MAEKIKISQLPPVSSLDGCYTIVTDKDSESKKADLGRVEASLNKKADKTDLQGYVSVKPQTLTPQQQAQARDNVGAGTSSFSGSYNDLTDKPSMSEYSLAANNDGQITYYLLGSAASSATLGRTALNGELTVIRGGSGASPINYNFQINAVAAYTSLWGNVVGTDANPNVRYRPQIVTLTYQDKPYLALYLSAHPTATSILFRGRYDKNGDNEVFQKVANDAVSNVVDITTRNIAGKTVDSILSTPQTLTNEEKTTARDNIGASAAFITRNVNVSGGVATITTLTDGVIYVFSDLVTILRITGTAASWTELSMAILCLQWTTLTTPSISYGSTAITAFDATAPLASRYAEISIFNNKAKLTNGL